jgi:hypothetical protein
MAEIDEAFHKLSNQNKTFGNIEYFFTQRKVNEDQEYLDKSLNRKNKNISVVYNFLAINIPNVLVDEITTGFDIEIFGDNGFHYKAFLASFQGTVPNFLIPLKGDRKMFVNILPKIESKETKYESENLVFKKNYVAFIEIPKRYQTFEENISNKLLIDEKEVVEDESEENDSE